MAEYAFDAVRWLRVRARAARAQRNFTDENNFYQVAQELEALRAENLKLKETACPGNSSSVGS